MRNKILNYASESYGTSPEYLWADSPNVAVLRRKDNKKWYAIIMDISYKTLGIEKDGKTDIINVKAEPMIISSLTENDGYLPAYHMNKTHWITVLLDGTIELKDIIPLIDISYELVGKK